MDFDLPAGDRTGGDRAWRAAAHRALGDEGRLALVDALRLTDRSPGELGELLGMSSNLLAHHLDVLEAAGVVRRLVSQGDGRRRYVTLTLDDPLAGASLAVPPGRVLFVCSHNAARSQLASALWTSSTGREASSAGSTPAASVDATAVAVAAGHGLDLAGRTPQGYDAVTGPVALVVSVCDRAFEQGDPFDVPRLHWSVRDPVGGGRAEHEAAFADIRRRVQRLAAAV